MKNYNILEDERPSKAFLNLENAKKGYNEVILLNKVHPNYDPTKAVSDENTRLVPITDRQGINDEFHQAFQNIYSKQEVNDNSESFLIVVVTSIHQNSSNPKPSLMKKAME